MARNSKEVAKKRYTLDGKCARLSLFLTASRNQFEHKEMQKAGRASVTMLANLAS